MKTLAARFLLSASDAPGFPEPRLPEIAIVGKSNSGKSTLLNMLVGIRGLARVSARPGRTREVVFFEVQNKYLLVDLPGYGYAKAPKSEQARWKKLVESYFSRIRMPVGVVALFDIRRQPDERDQILIDMLLRHGLAIKPVWTKADKLPKSRLAQRCKELELCLGLPEAGIPVSSRSRMGRDELLEWIDSVVPVMQR